MSFSVVIPSRSVENLVPCVRAIREAGETCRIIVVDDGIQWGSECGDKYAALPSWAWPIDVIEGIRPFVFSRNVNLGIAAAGNDDLILLNDDALLKTQHGFTDLEKVSLLSPEVGIIASACNNVGNPNQFLRKPATLRYEPRMVCFVCVYVPRSTINAVGLLDERFGSGGFEDDDYCLRVRRAGLKIGIFDGCFIDHASLPSTFRAPGGPGYNPRGAEIFRAKWGAGNHDL